MAISPRGINRRAGRADKERRENKERPARERERESTQKEVGSRCNETKKHTPRAR